MKHANKIAVGAVGGLFIAASIAATILTGGIYPIVLGIVSVATAAGLTVAAMRDERKELESNIRKNLKANDYEGLNEIVNEDATLRDLPKEKTLPYVARNLANDEFQKKYPARGFEQVGMFITAKMKEVLKPKQISSEKRQVTAPVTTTVNVENVHEQSTKATASTPSINPRIADSLKPIIEKLEKNLELKQPTTTFFRKPPLTMLPEFKKEVSHKESSQTSKTPQSAPDSKRNRKSTPH